MIKKWSEEELSILEEYYPIGGYFLCKKKGLSRNRDATLKKAQSLKIKVENKNYRKGCQNSHWADWELTILKTYYAKEGSKGMVSYLPHRTYSAIYLKATELGLYTSYDGDIDRWTKAELNMLEEYYPIGGSKLCISKGLNRSSCAIIKKAYSEGIKMDEDAKLLHFSNSMKKSRSNYVVWTDDDVDILNKYFVKYGAKECQIRGLYRSLSSIYRKASRLGLTKKGVKAK